VHVLIEMKPKGSTAWEVLGRFSASAADIAELKTALEGREPLKAIDRVTHPLMRDLLSILKESGHEGRVTFIEEH
jgi:hypothetical protein